MSILPNIDPTTTQAWSLLKAHYNSLSKQSIQHLHAQDPNRYASMHLHCGNVLLDYSKQLITNDTLQLLVQLAQECKLPDAIQAMVTGQAINVTEGRAVLHTALRAPSNAVITVDGNNVMPHINAVRQAMEQCCNSVHNHTWLGYTGKPIKYIVNIGIGGSDLGPAMVTEALKAYWINGIHTYYVSNVDASHIHETLKLITPHETLFLIASKTFTTQETMTNAHTARQWFLSYATDEAAIAKHFVALSTNEAAVQAFGIPVHNMFPFWNWVGGRYSLWSAIGLSIALTIGYAQFELLLQGAHAMDTHFEQEPLAHNMPVIMALLGIWHTNFGGCTSEVILPYSQYLHRFAAYLQQANMESNGKAIDRNGKPVTYSTGPVVWGEPGTNGQHAFYQLLHQGTAIIPADFIGVAHPAQSVEPHHSILMANYFAQSQALMQGITAEQLQAQGVPPMLIPYKSFGGNRPSNSILLKQLNAYTLGQLIALYEHKIFVQGIIWNIYSFDQYGVELGKVLASAILPNLHNNDAVTAYDSSTNGLINQFKAWK